MDNNNNKDGIPAGAKGRSSLYRLSVLYLIFLLLLLATTKVLCFVVHPGAYSILVFPLAVFLLLTMVYFSFLVKSRFERNDSKIVRHIILLVLYFVVSCFLLWLLCFRCCELAGVFFPLEKYPDYQDVNELSYDSVINNYYDDYSILISSILLLIVFLPCIIVAIKCLASEIKRCTEKIDSLEMEKLKKVYRWLIAISLIFILPFPFSIIVFIPVISWELLSFVRKLFLLLKR